MLCFRPILSLGVSLLLPFGLAQVSSDNDEYGPAEIAEFERLLASLPPESLKAALQSNLWPKYQDGVFVDGQDAIEAIHNHDPELATKLVEVAKQDVEVKEYLRKRQTTASTNGTTSTTSSVDKSTSTNSTSPVSSTETFPASSSTSTPVIVTPSSTPTSVSSTSTTVVAPPPPPPPPPPPASSSESSQTGVLIPVGVSTTGADGSPSVETTEAFATTAPTSVEVPVSTTNAQGESTIMSTKAPAIVLTQTDTHGATHITTSLLASVQVAPGGSIVTSAPPADKSAGADLVTTTDKYGNKLVLSNPHADDVYTTTDDKGREATITYNPGGGVVSEVVVHTTILPDGQRSTVTSFEIVGGTVVVTKPTEGAGAETSKKPGLQSGAALPSSFYAAEVAVLIGAAIGVAAFL